MVKDSFSIASMPKNATGNPSKKALDNGRLEPHLPEDSDLDETVNFNDLNTLAKTGGRTSMTGMGVTCQIPVRSAWNG